MKHHLKIVTVISLSHQFEEVQKHLQDMLDIGAIRHSCSPWASAVVLVWKKDGSLRFCIDLRHLNSHTIKDAYSLQRIEESLDSLNGACIFMSLDLKSGYWQVEMDEKSIPYTAFTVGPLGFYKCICMPFGLTNALKWAITDQFHKYLYGGTFEVHSNNNPLTYVLTTAKLDTTEQRWVASLANYNFTITYHSGKHNIDADALSRVPWNIATTDQPLLIRSALIRGTQGESSIPMIPPDISI